MTAPKIWITTRGEVVRDADGQIVGLRGTVQDITERKRAMKEIESLAKFPEENPNPVMRIAANGAIIYANPSSAPLLKAWGCQVGEMLPDDYRNLILEALRSGNRNEIEATSGNTIYSLIIAPIVDMGYVNVYGRDVTQHRLADKARKESEQRFRDAIDNFPNVFVIYDADRRVTYVNSNGLQIMGLSEQEVIGKKDEEIFPPEMINSYLPALKLAVETKMPQMLERTRPASMGGQTIIANIVPLLDEGGEIRRILGITYDISERKRAEEALQYANEELLAAAKENQRLLAAVQEERDRLSALINSISDEIWFADAHKKFTLANPSALREFGLSTSEDVNVEELATSLEVYRLDGSPRPVEEAPPLLALQGEIVRNQEEMIRTPVAGELRYRQVNSSPVRDVDGNIIGSVSVVRDITEQKRAEEALKESEERYRSLFNSMTEGFALHEIILDENGKPFDYRFLDVNPAFERLTGLKREDVIGKTHNEALPGDSSRWVEEYGTVALTGEPAHFENYSPALERHYEVFAYRPASGQFAVIFVDITERKRAEEVLRTTLQRFYAVLSSMYAGILLVADDGRIEFANQAFCDIFDLLDSPADLTGLSSPEMIDKIKNGYLHPDEEVTSIREIVVRGQPVKGQEIAMRDERTCLRDFIPLYVDGKSYGRLWHHLEITERKRQEEQISRLTKLYSVLSRVNEAIVRVPRCKSHCTLRSAGLCRRLVAIRLSGLGK